ncbi:hypothetical protein D3C83_178010 [compost metagenome]
MTTLPGSWYGISGNVVGGNRETWLPNVPCARLMMMIDAPIEEIIGASGGGCCWRIGETAR